MWVWTGSEVWGVGVGTGSGTRRLVRSDWTVGHIADWAPTLRGWVDDRVSSGVRTGPGYHPSPGPPLTRITRG